MNWNSGCLEMTGHKLSTVSFDVRAYNSALAFTSVGVALNENLTSVSLHEILFTSKYSKLTDCYTVSPNVHDCAIF